MPTYRVSAREYYEGLADSVRFSSPCSFTGTAENVARCEQPMTQLIARYGLAGKSVLSLGCGTAFEERWFHAFGCSLTLNDLDEPHHQSEPYLQSLRMAAEADPDAMPFFIEDAAQTIGRYRDGLFDVLYVSSFHPDELRREEIQANCERTRHGWQRLSAGTWPVDAVPYTELLMSACACVRVGGLIIFQHYRGGAPLHRNPNCLAAVERQFAAHGVVLLEGYAFRRAPAVSLLVAVRGDETVADRLGRRLQEPATPRLAEFHGRYEPRSIAQDLVCVYDRARGGTQTVVWPLDMQLRWRLRRIAAAFRPH